MRKTYVVGGARNYANWMMTDCVPNMEDADLVCFTGGSDVMPAIYGKKCHPYTSFDITRDNEERHAFQLAQAMGKPMIGICRGSQLGCALSGGILVQHQSHPAIHDIYTPDGEVTVTSSHHQRMWPWKLPESDYRVLGWCNLSPFSWGENDQDDMKLLEDEDVNNLKEVEICYFPKTNFLGIQSHPEWQNLNSPSIKYFRNLLNAFLAKDL